MIFCIWDDLKAVLSDMEWYWSLKNNLSSDRSETRIQSTFILQTITMLLLIGLTIIAIDKPMISVVFYYKPVFY